MKILTLETTCDETAAAVVTDDLHVLSSVVASQDHLHQRFAGVVPEIAARAHVERILPVIDDLRVLEAVDVAATSSVDFPLRQYGARHRAAASFAATHPDSVVFLASADGGITTRGLMTSVRQQISSSPMAPTITASLIQPTLLMASPCRHGRATSATRRADCPTAGR